MARRPSNPGSWPRLMRAETAAAYVDERSVEAFLQQLVVTVRHMEQSQLRLRMRSSRPTITSGSPRRSRTFFSFMRKM
jgi:hypothetical protein